MYDLVDFAHEFVNTARKFAFEFPAIKKTFFTSRQSIAITSLGVSRILRSRNPLTADSLIQLSIITSPPEAQKYAEFIALKILYGDESVEIEKEISIEDAESNEEENDNQLTATRLLLQDLLNFLNLEKSINVNKDMKVINFADALENELFVKKNEKGISNEVKLQLARLRLAFEIVGGRAGIITHNISNNQEMIKVASHILIQDIPNIRSQGLISSQLLGISDQIAKLTFEKFIEYIANLLVATSLSDPEEIKDDMEIIFSEFSQYELHQGYTIMLDYRSLLLRFNVSEPYYAPLLKEIIKRLELEIITHAEIIDDFLDYPSLFQDPFDRTKLEEILSNSIELYEDKLELLKKANEFDQNFGTNISELFMDKIDTEQIQLEDLTRNPLESAQWQELFEQSMESVSNAKLEFSDYDSLLNEIRDLHSKLENTYSNEYLKNMSKEFLKSMATTSNNTDDLQFTVDKSRELGLRIPLNELRQRGHELGMTNEEIARLLGDLFEYFKELITNDHPSYERSNQILKKISLSTDQFNELTDLSIKHKQEGALGALASQDLMTISQKIPKTKEGDELLDRALGAGGGENLLEEWFKHGKKLPARIRKIVKDATKRIMIDLAKTKSASLIGSSEAGPLPEGSIRPYILGDDLDLVDIDESLDNILSLGKRIDDVVPEDFIVRKTVSGRRCVIFLIDISGSMSGAPLASASLAAAMLLMAFARDELGVALFESNTHVLCSINDVIEIDEVVDEILELTARGGTQMQRALAWAENQFVQSTSSDKMFVMVSDAMIGDFERSKKHLKAIAEMDATSIMIMPNTGFGMGNVQNILEEANAQLVTVSDWKNFPEIVSEVLSRS
ncbi:MAG: VWA domain-containing protein [Candidatus Heimdallarchaeota archaeon]|nr:VWA domain-containing protein [Candidatus Heimdallarchaeota archaeon]